MVNADAGWWRLEPIPGCPETRPQPGRIIPGDTEAWCAARCGFWHPIVPPTTEDQSDE